MLRLRLSDRVVSADVVRDGDTLHVFIGARHRSFTPVDPLGTVGEPDQDEDRLCAPMPGKIIAIHASIGDRVRRGQLLLVMEAMKMEHSILAPVRSRPLRMDRSPSDPRSPSTPRRRRSSFPGRVGPPAGLRAQRPRRTATSSLPAPARRRGAGVRVSHDPG